MRPIQTERLLVRPFTMADLEDIHRIVFADPDVTWVEGRVTTLEETREYLAYRIGQAKRDPNFGVSAIVRRQDSKPLGLVSLGPYLASFVRLADDPDGRFNSIEVELGYALGKAYQGKGYATEAGKGVVAHAFGELKLRRLLNTVRQDNERSINLMRRLGFRIVRNVHPQWPGVVGVLDSHAGEQEAPEATGSQPTPRRDPTGRKGKSNESSI